MVHVQFDDVVVGGVGGVGFGQEMEIWGTK